MKSIYKNLNVTQGLGVSRIKFISSLLGFPKNLKIKGGLEDFFQIVNFFYCVDIFLKKKNLYNLKKIRGYKLFCLNYNIPARGQRTKTNAKTVKRKKKKFN